MRQLMKKKHLVLLLLFYLALFTKIYAESGEIRHLWLHPNRYANTDENRHLYFEKAEALGVNSIFMFVDALFENRKDFYRAIIDSANQRNMKLFIAYSWHLDESEYKPALQNLTDYIYRPLNLNEEQWVKCINSAEISNRGFTSQLDKNNPNTKELTINELMKYMIEYPDIAGIVWDVSRMHGLFGSYHKSEQEYIMKNSEIDIKILHDEVYGKFPMPAFRTRSSVGTEPTTCKVLANYHSDTNYDYLGITLQEHKNNGHCLVLNRNSSALEIPLYTTVVKNIIVETGYKQDTLYIKHDSWLNNGAYEFAFSMDMIGKFVEDVSEVPDGAPYIITDGVDIGVEETVSLKKHADTGASIILGQPPYWILKDNPNPPEEVVELVGFKSARYVNPEFNETKYVAQYLYLTEEGKKYNFPETSMDINSQIELAENWMQWNANEMLGGTIRDMRIALKTKFSDRKLNIGCTRYSSDPWYQQQDWGTWLKNGYIDYNTIMLYYDSPEDLDKYLAISAKALQDNPQLFKDKVQPILAMHINTENHQSIIDQAQLVFEKYDLKGFGLFESVRALNEFSIDDCQNINNKINRSTKPLFYWPEEKATLFDGNTSFSLESDQLNFGLIKTDSLYTEKVKIFNNGDQIIDVVDIYITGKDKEKFHNIEKQSFIIRPGESEEISLNIQTDEVGDSEAYLNINSNMSNQSNYQLPVYAISKVENPQIITKMEKILFTETTLRDTARQKIVIKNNGLNPLKLFNIQILDTTSEFSISSQIFQEEIACDDSIIIDIKFHPNERGEKQNYLELISNDADKDTLIIDIQGKGSKAPKLKIKTGS